MQKSKMFGRVRVRLDELHGEGIIDFAELLKKNAPAPAAEPAEDCARAEREPVAEPAASALRSDGIEGDDMSDGDDDQHGQQKPKKGRSIFESIIAKWSSLSAPGQERDSDEDDDGALSGGAGDAGIDSGQPHARVPSLCVSLPAPSSGRLPKWISLPRARAPETSMVPARISHARARLLAPARVPMQTTTTTTMA
jgi:hypothetical protein